MPSLRKINKVGFIERLTRNYEETQMLMLKPEEADRSIQRQFIPKLERLSIEVETSRERLEQLRETADEEHIVSHSTIQEAEDELRATINDLIAFLKEV